MGIIYKITNKINNKSYIGQTRNTLNKRLSAHKSESKTKDCMPLYRAIRKYGWENFEYSILEDEIILSELNEREICYIKHYDTYRNGYNATTGGDVPLEQSKESRYRQSEALKGRATWNKGKKGIYSKETLKKMGEANALMWEITYPNGRIEIIKNLHRFCRKHNLIPQCMIRIPKGIQKQHKGFKCRKVIELP